MNRAGTSTTRMSAYPDERLRQRPLLGLTIASGLHYHKGRWQGATIYDPGSGNRYRCQLELAADGFLRVRGYLGISLLGRTQYWQRAHNFKRQVTRMLRLLDEERVTVAVDSHRENPAAIKQ